MAPIVRFAPSPTGRLHIGNIRTAVLNWLFARKTGGTFILRLDDTDQERSTEAFADAIRRDLAWLGLEWAREERQSARSDRYAAAAERLKASGRLYPCYETEDELDRRRKRQLALGRPPIYDRASLKLNDADRASIVAEGRRPHWRFRLANAEPGTTEPLPTMVSWNDCIRGDQMVDAGSLSDPVLIRGDGTALYTFTSVVDDLEFGITHVIRGEDHVTNTGVQIQLFEALGGEPPMFGHHSLLIGPDGQALSKRLGALSIEGFREAGIEPLAVVAHAALVGTSDAVQPMSSLDALAAMMAFEKISMAPGRFDIEELRALNARHLLTLPYAAVADRLAELGVGGRPGDARDGTTARRFWEAVRGNIGILADVRSWWEVVGGNVAPIVEEPALLAVALRLLPHEPWDEATWGQWTTAIKAETSTKGRALFHPLRLVLTGRESGPDLKMLLPLIGRKRAAARLAGQSG